MKKTTIHIIVAFLGAAMLVSCNTSAEKDAIKRLEDTIQEKPILEQRFLNRLNGLKSQLDTCSNKEIRWDLASRLYEEYHSYDIDSALTYSNMLTAMADNEEKAVIASGAEVACLCALRRYSSIERLLERIDTSAFNDRQRYAYYKARIALYTALGNEFGTDKKQADSNRLNRYRYQELLSALPSLSDNERKYLKAKQMMLVGKYEDALLNLHQLLEKADDISQKLHTTYAIANCYNAIGDRSSYKRWLAETAIFDFKRQNRQYRSLYDLALCLYEDGQHRKAGEFIQITVLDAIACKHDTRIVNAVEAQMIISASMEESGRRERWFIWFFVSIMLLAIVIISATLAKVDRQRKRLKLLMRQTKEYNIELSKKNAIISEANLIKEKYMFKYMYLSANFIKEMDEYRKDLRHTYKEEGTEALVAKLREPEHIYLQYKSFYKLFDEIFLGIFPDFPEKVNKLLKKDRQITMKHHGIMPTELRILAAIRLGITESRRIAEFLNTSVNTIYTYRTKMRYDSLDGPELFEEKVKNINYFNI